MLSLYGYCVVTFLLLWQKQFKKGNILLWFSLLESPFITVGMSRNLIRLVAVRRKRTINTCVHYATEPLPHDLTGKMCYGCFHSVCASMLWVLSFCVYIHPCYESFRSVCASIHAMGPFVLCVHPCFTGHHCKTHVSEEGRASIFKYFV